MTKSINDIANDPTPNGIRTEMPRHEYDAVCRLNMSSISEGFLDHEEVDPLAIKDRFEAKPEFVSQTTKDFRDKGTLAHMMLLQPERIAHDVAIWKGGDRRGSDWQKFLADNPSRLVVRQCDFDEVSEACREFRFNPRLLQLLSDIDVEVAVFSQHHGIKTKGLIDAVTRGEFCRILDLKTTWTGKLTERDCNISIRNFHNREKLAAYSTWYAKESGREVERCLNVFLLMRPPYRIRIMEFPEFAIEWGLMRTSFAIKKVADCLDRKKWPIFCGSGLVDVAQFEMPHEEDDQVDYT